jgi:hypothetical protein
MSLLDLMNHLYAISYGILSSCLYLGFLYLAGIILFPSKLFFFTLEQCPQENGNSSNINFSALPLLYSSALFCIICWYGITLAIPLFTLFEYFSSGVLFIGLIRFIIQKKYFSSRVKSINIKKILSSFFIPYAIFYILAYLSLLPSFSPDANLLRWIGNNDILNYINITHYFSHLGPSNLVGHSYIQHASYAATPGAFYCFSLLSLFYRGDTMSAAMPMLFMCMACIGMMIYHYCKALFELSQPIAISIAAVIIFGGFYHYIEGNYFLSTLIVTSPLIYLMTKTVELDYTNSSHFKPLFYITLPSLMLIFFFYPVILFCSFIIQLGLIGLKVLFSYKDFSIKILSKNFFKSAAILFLCLAIVAVSNLANFISFLSTLLDFANMKGGGWGLPLLSPFAILGVPSAMTLHSLSAQILIVLAFSILLIFSAMGTLELKRLENLNTSAIVLFIFSAMAFIVYLLYYYHLGPSRYQPWKFASYYALPFAGGIWAMFSRVLQSKNTDYPWNRITIILVILAIVGNIFIIWRATPPFQTLSDKYRQLSTIDKMDITDVWVKMADYSSTFLPVYFIPHKKLHLLSDSYYPVQSFNINKIGSKQPLFIETTGECIGASSDKVIKFSGLGCLYLTMPTMQFNETIKLNKDWMFIQTTGFSNPESWGRWSSENEASITLYANVDLLTNHQTGYIRLKITPFIYPDIEGQHITTQIDKNPPLSLFIKNDQWISLPYKPDDWEKVPGSNSLRKLTISLQFPDVVPADQLDPESPDKRSLGIGLLALQLKNN